MIEWKKIYFGRWGRLRKTWKTRMWMICTWNWVMLWIVVNGGNSLDRTVVTSAEIVMSSAEYELYFSGAGSPRLLNEFAIYEFVIESILLVCLCFVLWNFSSSWQDVNDVVVVVFPVVHHFTCWYLSCQNFQYYSSVDHASNNLPFIQFYVECVMTVFIISTRAGNQFFS